MGDANRPSEEGPPADAANGPPRPAPGEVGAEAPARIIPGNVGSLDDVPGGAAGVPVAEEEGTAPSPCMRPEP